MVVPLFTVLSLISTGAALKLDECSSPLGMQSGAIADTQLTASSSFDPASLGPTSARIRTDHLGGAWCPDGLINDTRYEYLQIVLGRARTITGVETQGRYGGGQGLEFMTDYRLEYRREGCTGWIRYTNASGHELLPGNTDTKTAVYTALQPPLHAVVAVRLVPFSLYPRTVCLRAELHGCNHTESAMSYELPAVYAGSQFGADVTDSELAACTNASGKDGGVAGRPGVGKLNNGQVGTGAVCTGKPTENTTKQPTGSAWVAWKRNDTGPSVTLKFSFSSVRRLSALRLHTIGCSTRQAGAFNKATIYLSRNGNTYFLAPVNFTRIKRSQQHDTAHWVDIDLEQREARQVTVHLFFSDEFLLLSEVRFVDAAAGASAVAKGAVVTTAPPVLVDRAIDAEIQDEHYEDVRMVDSHQPPAYASTIQLIVIIGVAGACVVTSLCVVSLLLLRRRRHTSKLCGTNSPLYTGLKMPPYGFSDSFSTKDHPLGAHADSGHLPQPAVVLTTNSDGSHTISSSSGGGMAGQQGRLAQAPNGNLYVLAANGTHYALAPQATHGPTINGVPFSPPPVPKNSDYAEPLDYSDAKCSTLPLRLKQSTSSTPVSARKPAPPPRSATTQRRQMMVKSHSSTTASPRHQAKRRKRRPIDCDALMSERLSEEQLMLKCGTTNSDTSTSEPTEDTGYSSPSTTPVPEVARHRLRFRHKLGAGEFGEVHLCDVQVEDSETHTVAVKMLRNNAGSDAVESFLNEMRVLARLHDANIVQLLGACTTEQPLCMVVEYMRHGDLHQYLHKHPELSTGALLYMATQMASGMKYLESLNFVHRDLACRNILVGDHYVIKIADFGMAIERYVDDYYPVDGRYVVPVRWMAPEAIAEGRFTPASDVWSFGVTLWEMLTMAEEQPHSHLTSQQVIDTARALLTSAGRRNALVLPRPQHCADDVYNVVLQCTSVTVAHRPSFQLIYKHLKQTNLAFETFIHQANANSGHYDNS